MSNKFKNGDKVNALRDALDITAGTVYEVKYASDWNPCVIDNVGESNALLSEDDYELVTESEEFVAAFKVGDRVRIVKEFKEGEFCWTPQMTGHIGQEGVVIQVPTADCGARIYCVDVEGDRWYYLLPSLELATHAPETFCTIRTTGGLQYTTKYEDAEAARQWLKDTGDDGVSYVIQTVTESAPITVSRSVELKEAA